MNTRTALQCTLLVVSFVTMTYLLNRPQLATAQMAVATHVETYASKIDIEKAYLPEYPPQQDFPINAVQATQQPSAAPEANDERFVADSGGDLDQYLFRENVTNGRLIFDIQIGRYFSSWVTEQNVDENGFLTEATVRKLIEKNIMPENARLHLRAYDVDEDATGCAEVDHLYVNGRQLNVNGNAAKLSGANETWSEPSFDVPLGFLKFPTAPGKNGQPPQSVNNEIGIEINVLGCVPPDNSQPSSWAVEIDWGYITIPDVVRPIIFAHGWTGNVDAFKNFEDNAIRDGLVSAGRPDLAQGILPIAQTSPVLIQAINRAIVELGVNKLNVFGHSKGGLVTRHALRNSAIAQKVEHLITFGSPHHGTDWMMTVAKIQCREGNFPVEAERTACQTAAKELTVDAIRDNFNYSGCRLEGWIGFREWKGCIVRYIEQPAVTYRSFVGSAGDIGTKSATYPWRSDVVPYPNTGVVDQHFGLGTTHLNIHTNDDSYKCAISYLDTDLYPRATCPGTLLSADAQGQSSAPIWPPDSYQIIVERSLSLIPNQTEQSAFALDVGQELLVNLLSSQPIANFSLTTPTGQRIAPTSTDIVLRSTSGEWGYWYQYAIPSPVSGNWLIDTQFSVAATAYLDIRVNSPTRLLLRTDLNAYQPNQLTTVQAAIVNEATPLLNSTISVSVTQADDQLIQVLTLVDNGTNGDETANDGIYAGQFVTPDQNGRYVLSAQATQASTVRQQESLITVATQTAEFSGVRREDLVDSNGNGLANYLRLTVDVNVKQIGHYELLGTLIDKNGTAFASASISTRREGLGTLQPGVRQLQLDFDGTTIREHGVDGVYQLATVIVEDQSGESLQVDIVEGVYTTQSYLTNQFEGETVALGQGQDYVSDVDDNGRYDKLTIQLTLDLSQPDIYSINGRLIDIDGQEIMWSSTQITVTTSGIYTSELEFGGTVIGRAAANGPYTLRDLTVFGQTTGGTRSFTFAYTTATYRFTQFEEGFHRIYLPLVQQNNLSMTCTPTLENDSDTLETAIPLCSGHIVSGNVSSNDTVDVYKITVAASQHIRVELSGTGGDADLYLYPPTATSLAAEQAAAYSVSTSNTELIEGLVPQDGEWYVAVFSYSGATAYELNITISDSSRVSNVQTHVGRSGILKGDNQLDFNP